MEGRKILRPMKNISIFLLASILAVLCNYAFVKSFSQTKKPKEELIVDGLSYHESLKNVSAIFTHETKVYNPASSDSGGGSFDGGSSSGG